MELFALFIKTIAILFSGVFGLLGAVNSFRDDSGKITTIGAVSIFGIVISIFLALVAQGFEHTQKMKADEISRNESELLQQKLDDAKNELQAVTAELENTGETIDIANLKIDNLKEKIGKPVIPIRDILFYGYYIVNLDTPKLSIYSEFLDSKLSRFRSSQNGYNLCKKDDSYDFYIDNNPHNDSENKSIANNDIRVLLETLWITTTRVSLAFYREYNEDRIFLPFAGGGTGPDEKIKFNPDLRVPTTIESKTCFLYFPHSKKILIGLKGRSIDNKIIHYTGKITSTAELPLSTMFFSFSRHFFHNIDNSMSRSEEIYNLLKKQSQIGHMYIQIGSYSFKLFDKNLGNKLTKYQDNSWKYTFPQDIYSLSTTSVSGELATEAYVDMISAQSDIRK